MPASNTYETVAGGSGAGPGFAGASVVQTHMTNSVSRTPRYCSSGFRFAWSPLKFAQVPAASGRWPGGDGGVRRIRFLTPMTAAILSNGRKEGAFGMAGGGAGAPGQNYIERIGGQKDTLGAVGQAEMAGWRCVVIITPGGGACGGRLN